MDIVSLYFADFLVFELFRFRILEEPALRYHFQELRVIENLPFLYSLLLEREKQ